MKIIILCLLHIDELPPLMTNLKVLSKKYDVLYIGVDDGTNYIDLFNNKVKFINLIKDKHTPSISNQRIRDHIDRKLFDYYVKKANSIIESNCKNGDLIWVHHEFSLLKIDRINLPYYLTMYELHDDLFKKDNELKQRIRMARKVIVPEYTRSAIVQACVGLKELPYVIPNKPYDYDDKSTKLDNNPIDSIVEDAHKSGKKIILYSGIFLRERKLEPFIEAIENLRDKFVFVLIGRKSEYLEELLNKYPNIKYLGFYNPPQHMSIIKKSDIGILTYVADNGSINSVFCAPNKIWEYSKYGIPMLCNDIPGLKYTVEYGGFGYCCDINSTESIISVLNKINDNYGELSKNAYKFYETIDIEKTILNVIQ